MTNATESGPTSSPPIADLFSLRRSPRAFDERRPVDRHTLLSLLEAARWAPSSRNEQPWQYVVFDQSQAAAREQARACLTDGNAWARKAPVLVLSVARDDFTRDGTPNRHAHHDVGLATANLALQAVALGLAVHQMAGFDADRARREFGIPPGFTPMAMIAVGYPYRGPLEDLPENIRAYEQRARLRRPLRDIAFAGRWDSPLVDAPPPLAAPG